jgi:hypothetical protein
MEKKKVNVIICFHAHEPLWDLPAQLQKTVEDYRVSSALVPENYLRKRMTEVRNIYRDLLSFISRLNIKVAVDFTNELLFQLEKELPQTYDTLRKSYQSGILYPIYTMAHHTHSVLLREDDFIEDFEMNREFLYKKMNVSQPGYPGFFFTECSVERKYLNLLHERGIKFILFPHLNPRKTEYTLEDPNYDYQYLPFAVDNLIALPRHFVVSQEIWRPITQIYPEKVKYQGYLLGEYYVFDNEYNEKKYLPFLSNEEGGIEEYVSILRKALEECPPNGLILYLQDLELMDFGDVALRILENSWRRILEDEKFQINFVTPDEYIAQEDLANKKLPGIGFRQISWAPEIRLVLRFDGHYPPLEAKEVNGTDIVPQIFKKYPFIFWQMGSYYIEFFEWLIESCGFPLTVGVSSILIAEEGYQLVRFPYYQRIPMHLRLMKRACNWGWRPDEGRTKRIYLNGFFIADSLLLNLKFYPKKFSPKGFVRGQKTLQAIGKYAEISAEMRIAYLKFGLKRLEDEKKIDPGDALIGLDYADNFKQQALTGLEKIRLALKEIEEQGEKKENFLTILTETREFCRNMFLSLEHIQRAWGKGGDIDFLVMNMYKYLYDVIPPKIFTLLEELEK